MRMKERKTPEKKTYAKPEIRKVKLHPEESLVAGCKTASTGGEFVSACNSPTDCFGPGS